MKITVASLFFALALSACNTPTLSTPEPSPPQAAANSEIWSIGSQYQDCVGVGPMKCLQVTKPNGNPELFYSSIEGFNYQEGFDYQIEVSSTPIPNPPADGSSVKYTLVKIISQKPAQ